MTDREKLIDLIYEGKRKRADICSDCEDCSLCERDADGDNCGDGIIADHLLANGVVVREKGEWLWSEENECWVCSKCELSALNNYRGNSTESNFCPTCGADMRKGENE